MRSILVSFLLLVPSLALAHHHDEPDTGSIGDEETTEEAPAEEAPAEEAPAEEAPAEEAPAEEAPAEEAPAEEAPAEEAPAAAAAPAPAAAPAGGSCTYEDLQGQFTVTVACDLLQDHTGNSQPHKRIWLGGTHSQFNIIEVPEPHRQTDLAEVMHVLGRDWGRKKTPLPITSQEVTKTKGYNNSIFGVKRETVEWATTFAGQPALVVTEHKQRSTSTTWIFNLNDRNVIVNAVALGKGGAKRKAHLAEVVAAVEAGFKLN